MQINDIESDLDDISIIQTEGGNTSDIIINYSSDASGIGTIIYDHHCDQVNTSWEKNCQHSTYYIDYFIIILILFELYFAINIIL